MTTRQRRRGSLEQLPSGRCRAVGHAGVDPLTGQRRKLTATAETRPEAERLLTKLQNQVDENQHPKSAITVADAITQWLEVADLE